MSSALDSDDQALLDALAARLSEHLERLRLAEQTNVALAETEGLYRLIARLSAAGGFDDILRALAESGWLRQAQVVALCLFDHPWSASQTEGQDRMRIYQTARLSDLPLEMVGQVSLDELTADPQALLAGGPHPFAHSQNDDEAERILTALFRQPPKASGTLFLPLLTGESCIGFIVSAYDQMQAWSAAEIERLAAIADQAATAVRGQVLLQQAHARARQEQRLRAASTQVFAAADINAVMRRAVEQVGQALGVSAYIYLDRAAEGGDSEDGADEA
jgi:GAF domain-containing protein